MLILPRNIQALACCAGACLQSSFCTWGNFNRRKWGFFNRRKLGNIQPALTLARAIGKKWSILWPKVKRNEEPTDTGRALTPEEEARLLKELEEARSPVLGTFVKALLLTCMRCGELTGMRWAQVDFAQRVRTVGKAKTDAGTGRQIPMNAELLEVMTDHAKWFRNGSANLAPNTSCSPLGSAGPMTLRYPIEADSRPRGATCGKRPRSRCRIHDLRHTAITKLAESGASDSTIMALAGHLSRAMMERYSHIRMNAKRQAVESLSLKPEVQPTPQSFPQSEETAPVLPTVKPS